MNRKNVFLNVGSARTANLIRAGIAGIGAALILALAGCPQPSGGGGSKTVSVTGVAIHADGAAAGSYNLWAEAETGKPNTVQLQAVITPTNATNKKVTWSASVPDGNYADYITLSATGAVTAASTHDKRMNVFVPLKKAKKPKFFPKCFVQRRSDVGRGTIFAN